MILFLLGLIYGRNIKQISPPVEIGKTRNFVTVIETENMLYRTEE